MCILHVHADAMRESADQLVVDLAFGQHDGPRFVFRGMCDH